MNNQEAYGNKTYEERLLQKFYPGDLVRVGPRYDGNGHYVADNGTGQVARVVRELPPSKYGTSRDYKLMSVNYSDEIEYDVCNVTRLILVPEMADEAFIAGREATGFSTED